MTAEIWKPIAGFDQYFVSNEGRVRSHNSKGNWTGEVGILKPRILASGYVEIALRKTVDGENKRKQVMLHTLVMRAFQGDYGRDECVRFLDGDRTNCRLDNLDLKRNGIAGNCSARLVRMG